MNDLDSSTGASGRLKDAISDLQTLQNVLVSGDLDARVLKDFRDALNSIRNMAWTAQQLVASQTSEGGPEDVASLLGSERIRAAYQLCQAISIDVQRDDIQFQKGQLSELYVVALQLVEGIKRRL